MPENRKTRIFVIIFVFVSVVSAFLLSEFTGTVQHERLLSSGVIATKPDFKGADGKYTYSFILPDDNLSGKYLSVGTFHFSVNISIDGETVYELLPSDPAVNRSTGNAWNCVGLEQKDAGRECTVTLETPYSSLPPNSMVYIGEKYDIIVYMLKNSGLRFFISLLIMVIGTVLFFYTLTISNITDDYKTLFFSLYCISLSVWSLTGDPVSAVFFRNGTLLMNLEHFTLALMPMLFTMFLREMYRNKKNILWKIIIISGVLITLARFILEAANITDVRETLAATQLHILLTIILGLVLSISEVRKNKITAEHIINYICLFVILLAALIELVLYRISQVQGVFGMICFLIYVLIVGINLVHASRKVKERAQEAEIYRNLAFTDVLTGAFSRTAFMNDIRKAEEKHRTARSGQIAVFMFDLNNLKQCNDEFGHENGDRYIKSVSEVLSGAVGLTGRLYRIGGDEFSALVEIRNRYQTDSVLSEVKERMKELNKEKFVVDMSVAAGYAVFDPDSDESIDDTMKRADEMMYENKQKMKNAF